MKKFLPTYLMIKTHKVTGLKYFCKTTKKDPHGYKGSGNYWKKHLKIHGRDVETEVLGYFLDSFECMIFALEFSEKHNIVNELDAKGKKTWANEKPENGHDGGKTYEGPRSKEVVERVTEGVRKFWKNATEEDRERARTNGKINGAKSKKRVAGEWNQTEESKKKLKEIGTGRKRSSDSVERGKKSNTGKIRTGKPLLNIRNGIKKYHEDTKKLPEEERLNLSKLRSQRAIQAKQDHPPTEETIRKIRDARSKQENVFNVGASLKGRIIVVNKNGDRLIIDKSLYESQSGNKEEWEYVFHRTKIAKERVNMKVSEIK